MRFLSSAPAPDTQSSESALLTLGHLRSNMNPFNIPANRCLPREVQSLGQRHHELAKERSMSNQFEHPSTESPISAPVSCVDAEPDTPFDDFDRKLLAEIASEEDRNGSNRNGFARPTQIGIDFRGRHLLSPESVPLDLPAPNLTTPLTSIAYSSPSVAVWEKNQRKPRERDLPGQIAALASSATGRDSDSVQSLPFANLGSNTLNMTPVVRGVALVSTACLSDRQRSLFKFPFFNVVQSKCFATAFKSDDNLVVEAPTGSGKTVVMELGILRLVEHIKSGEAKVVYQAPTKSLCGERCRDWQTKFGMLDIKCVELTGDTEASFSRCLNDAGIIITTPEKWDSITRKWRDHSTLMNTIKLFLIDEVHILKDVRGATLEAIVSRMKSAGKRVRFIGLSATIPNSQDIATWLTRSQQLQHLPARREVFDDTYRPVQLQKHVIGHEMTSNPWAAENSLTEKVQNAVTRYGRGKPTMVFCASKKSAQDTANRLARTWFDAQPTSRPWQEPTVVVSAENEHLQDVLRAGVAFHHASLTPNDRMAVEQGFLDGHINVICSTSTLAVGMNLPCYLVVLKGTQSYTDIGLQEYSSLEIMQMLGRAGRPQFETEACAVILTARERVQRYEKMIAGEEILESSLHRNLIEHLNAEISLGTINSRSSAKRWLESTFLYVRLQHNPSYYCSSLENNDHGPEVLLSTWYDDALQLLHQHDLIEGTDTLQCTEFGKAMARYCVKFKTMSVFLAAPTKAKVSDVLTTLTQAEEFQNFRLKQGEKATYKDINKANDIRYPIQIDVALTHHKISLLIQAKLGGLCLTSKDGKGKLSSGQVRQLYLDTSGAMNNARRLIRCLVDIFIHKQDSYATKCSLELARGLGGGVWEDTYLQLKQVPGIGDISARKLAAVGIKSVDTLCNTEPQRLEVILSKNPPFGHDLAKKLGGFPALRISAKENGRQIGRKGGIEVQLRCEIGFLNSAVPMRFNNKDYSVLFLCETSTNKLIDFRRFSPGWLRMTKEITLTVLVENLETIVRCHIMCDDIAGTSRFAEVHFNLPVSCVLPQSPKSSVPFRQTISGSFMKARDEREDFECEGLTDRDLLNLVEKAKSEDMLEDVKDIEDLIADTNMIEEVKHSGKRSLSNLEIGDRQPREPQRLPNGNWTCQHTCAEEGKRCGHKCCQVGTKRKPTKSTHKRQRKGDPKGGPKVDIDERKKTSIRTLQLADETQPETKLSSISAPSTVDSGIAGCVESETTSQISTVPNINADRSITASAVIKDVAKTSLSKGTSFQQTPSHISNLRYYDLETSKDVAHMVNNSKEQACQVSKDEEYKSQVRHSQLCLEQEEWTNQQSCYIDNHTTVEGWLTTTQRKTLNSQAGVISLGAAKCCRGCNANIANSLPEIESVAKSTKDSNSTHLHQQDLSTSICPRTLIRLEDETGHQNEQSIYAADQKRRWAEIESDGFSYEVWGKYVTIVDDPEED